MKTLFRRGHACLVLLCLALTVRTAAQPTDTLPELSAASEVNTRHGEQIVLMAPNGSALYFTRQGHPRNMGPDDAADIWRVPRNGDGSWSRALHAGAPINSNYEDQLVGIGPAGNWLVVLRRGQRPQLVWLVPDGRGWTEQESLPLPVAPDRLSHAHLDVQGQTLIFAADLPDGAGGHDLYMCTLGLDRRWSAPVALGPKVNTAAEEHSPFLAADGRTLYWTSDRGGGKGGLDLWMARRATPGQPWEEAINLGAVNTAADDYSISIPAMGQQAVVASLEAESGAADLRVVALPAELQPLPVTLVVGKCRLPDGAPPSGEQRLYAGTGPNRQPLRLSGDGSFCLIVAPDETLTLTAELPGFFTPAIHIDTHRPAAVRLDYDPNNSLLASGMSAAYFQRDAEIEALRLNLERTERDLQDLRQRQLDIRQRWMEGAWRKAVDYTGTGGPESPAGGTAPQWQIRGVGKASTDSLHADSLRAQVIAELETELAPEIGLALSEEILTGLDPANEFDRAELLGLLQQYLRASLPAAPAGGVNATADVRRSLHSWLTNNLRTVLRAEIRTTLEVETGYRRLRRLAEDMDQNMRRLVMEQVREEEKQGLAARIDGAPPAGAGQPSFRRLEHNLDLQPMHAGRSMVLEELEFAPNSTQLQPHAYAELNRLADLLRAYPAAHIEIATHTNGWLNHATAMRLSSQRARVIADYLAGAGIDRERIQYKGYGKTRPIADNQTPEGRLRNQRVEVKITAI